MRTFVGDFPQAMRSLPLDRRGFPVPWFVDWIDGEPCFPVMDVNKLATAIKQDRCWICGGRLWANKAFVIGPMCCINKLSSEPPSHVECARFAALNCPFLAHPKLTRSMHQGNQPPGAILNPAGVMIERNPGVCCVWITQRHTVEWHPTPHGQMPLFRLGPAKRLEFYAHSRLASKDEVIASVESGLPILEKQATADGPEALIELAKAVGDFAAVLDAHQWPAIHPIGEDVDLAALGFEVAS